jgi:hypothetical protein
VGLERTARGKSNVLIGVFGGVFPLILAAAPVGSGPVRITWVLLWLGALVLMFIRASRMGVTANASGLVVRNFGRDYTLRWDEVSSVEAGESDNVSGAVTTIVIRRSDGSTVIGRGASSYSRRTVERWRDELASMRPST